MTQPNDGGYEFDSDSHIYRINRRIVPSVTNVLRVTGISRDLRQVRPDVLRYKREIGRGLHRCAHLLQLRDLDWSTVDPQLEPYLNALLLWIGDTGFKAEHVELRRWPVLDGMGYGGTLDATGLIKGEPWMVDWKTTEGSPDPAWGVQLSAYESMIDAPLLPPFHYKRLTLQLLSNGKYRQKQWTDPIDLQVFKWSLALTWWKINNGEKPWIDQ